MNGTAESVGATQMRLLERAREFCASRQRRDLDVALEPELYMTAWARGPGQARLLQLARGWRAQPRRLAARARDIVNRMRLKRYAVTAGSTGSAFRNLVVSWALPGDFDAQGGYTDRYLGLSAHETPRTLWFLWLMNEPCPARLPANVRVFRRAPADSSGSVAVTPRGGAVRRCSAVVTQAQRVAAAVSEELRRAPIRQIFVPYEAQPFQHAVMLAAKQHDARIATVGYMHSVLPALPAEYVFRAGMPDRVLVNGVGQGEILTRLLGWPADRVRAVPSLRYLRDHEPPFAGRILLPYSCAAPDAMARRFENFMRAAPPDSMPRWQVRIHPVMAGEPAHRALAQRLEDIARRHADRTSQRAEVARQTVIFGATAAVIEALERGFDVLHLCSDPLFEKHSGNIWTHLDVTELGAGIFRYRLRTPGAYITFGTPGSAVGVLGLDQGGEA